jgi:hypothetical protein
MVRWRITPHGERSYWVISITEGTKSRQGIVLVRGNLEVLWMRIYVLVRSFTGSMGT